VAHFIVLATDRPDCLWLREQVRPEHRRFLRDPGNHCVRVLLAGPTLEETGQTMNGTLLVAEAESIEEVTRFVADDPYARAGLFEQVVIRPWNCGICRFEATSAGGA
jgi:uncharacterized protein